jgi:hypothetical protein
MNDISVIKNVIISNITATPINQVTYGDGINISDYTNKQRIQDIFLDNIYLDSSQVRNAGISICQAKDVRLSNITINAPNVYGICTNNSPRCKITCPRITNFRGSGDGILFSTYSNGSQVIGGEISDSKKNGISIVDSDDCLIEGVYLSGSYLNGININSSINQSNGTRILGNTITGSGFYGILETVGSKVDYTISCNNNLCNNTAGSFIKNGVHSIFSNNLQ